jgi:hypothetical protein
VLAKEIKVRMTHARAKENPNPSAIRIILCLPELAPCNFRRASTYGSPPHLESASTRFLTLS